MVNETDDDTNILKDIPCIWTEKKILLKYPGHPKQSKDSIQSLLKTMASSRKLGEKNPKMYMEPQRALNDERNLEKEVQAGDIRLSYFQLYYKDTLSK